MKTKILTLAITLVAAMVCGVPLLAAGGDMDFVDASFRDVGSNGCIKTEVFVYAHSGVKDAAPEASVKVSRYNQCRDDSAAEILIEASGTVQLPKNSLIVENQVQSAQLDTTVRVYDSVTEKEIPLGLNLTWTGKSGVKLSKSDFFYQAPGVLVKTNKKVNSISRIAEASGSVSDGFTNYAPGVSDDAEISTHAVKNK